MANDPVPRRVDRPGDRSVPPNTVPPNTVPPNTVPQRGIVEIDAVREMLYARAETIPVDEVVGYLEIGGPKLGRDYSDRQLADQIRASLDHLRDTWLLDPTEIASAPERASKTTDVAKSAGAKSERPVKVSPSVMCADFGHIEEGLRQLEAAGADLLHLDMADGHFVPNLLLGMDVVRWLRPKTALPLAVHLMVENPDDYIDPLAEIGVDYVAVHAEAARHLDRTLTRIREQGMKAGVALNPATPLDELDYVLERLDFVLLMTVNPGFAGRKLVASGIRKIADCRRYLSRHEVDVTIMVDGNVSFDHIPQMVTAGADILVAGTSSWFNRGAPMAEKTEAAISAGLKMRHRD